MKDLYASAAEWIVGDPDPVTRAELQGIVDSRDLDELTERMGTTLQFGTAGLRGRVEAGSNRMNRATVIRATRGVADYLLATTGTEQGPVVVGRDARLSSATFMEDTIAVLVAAGFQIRYFEDVVPTPLVAYASLSLGGVAAIVVTASHNPPADNGYKVYAANGAQIIPPTDTRIASAIAAVRRASEVPRAEIVGAAARPIGEEMFDEYLHEVAQSLPTTTGDRTISTVYTAMHGVGGKYVVAALDRFGFAHVHPVAAQFEPDGHFPTVAFPNPEEPGAMDLSHELASAIDADLVIANDPDTDRLAVSIPEPGSGYRQLSGNQIGVLLADYMLSGAGVEQPIVMNSIVSSPMLQLIAEHYGAVYDRTLTGFKWIWNAALDLEAEDRGEFVFGYEEALGYSVGQTVRDKDGISAAVAFAALVAESKADNETVWDRLARLYETHGLWVSTQKSIVRPGAEGADEIAAAMALLAERTPDTLGGLSVVGVTDYRLGAENRPRYLAATPLVELSLGDAGRALIRPSGTEPKLKIYVDLRGETGDDWLRAEEALLEKAQDVAEDAATFLGI
jgi:phosphomannomutase